VSENTFKPETVVLHGAHRFDPATNAVAVPIYQTTSYQFEHTQHAENLFALKELGNIYTRIMNPTNDVLERRFAELEGGVAALALGSGQAASTFCVLNLCRAGDNFVSSTDLYGGTWNLFANTLSDLGVEARFVDPADPEAFANATDDRTRCYYAETLPNPKLNVFPIREVAEVGRKLGVPLIVDGGNFDWEAHADRFPTLNEPDLFIQGLETLPLRMRAHNENAARVADYLAAHPKVTHVIFPGFQEGEVRRRADAYLTGGYGALVGFELAAGREGGRRFIDALQMVLHVANIGDARTLAIHPATTTHSQLSPEDQLRTGVSEGYVRLSVGIEHIDDILADIGRALDAV